VALCGLTCSTALVQTSFIKASGCWKSRTSSRSEFAVGVASPPRCIAHVKLQLMMLIESLNVMQCAACAVQRDWERKEYFMRARVQFENKD
jgi:hypothetical protein